MATTPPHNRPLDRPPITAEPEGSDLSRLRLALKQTVAQAPHIPTAVLNDDLRSLNLLQREIECSRMFNFELPEDVLLAIALIENAVLTFIQAKKCALLLFNTETGSYDWLNGGDSSAVTEITQLSDDFLRQLLGSTQVIQSDLLVQGKVVGIVAVADRLDNHLFEPWDDILLELMATYLGPKLLAFNNLKQNAQMALVQKIILAMSSQLITAVDQEGVLMCTLSSLAEKLDFELGQYIELNPETSKGQVLVEYQHGEIRSYVHAGLESQRKPVESYLSLISLFKSSARRQPYLYLPGEALGSTPIRDIFHLEAFQQLPGATSSTNPKVHHMGQVSLDKAALDSPIVATVVMPVLDPVTGDMRGTINLYKTNPNPLGPEVFDIAREMVSLISLTLSRVMVLEKALALASTDELTGLTNRRGFYERFESEIERARRNQTTLGVALIDVDHFKKLNDTYGHLNGDLVLKTLAKCFKESFRKSDLVSRFGGEEFAIILPDTNVKSAGDLMERIRKKIASLKMTSIEGHPLKTSCSIGLVQVSTDHDLSEPVDTIISRALAQADERLYKAKESGRNQVCLG